MTDVLDAVLDQAARPQAPGVVLVREPPVVRVPLDRRPQVVLVPLAELPEPPAPEPQVVLVKPRPPLRVSGRQVKIDVIVPNRGRYGFIPRGRRP